MLRFELIRDKGILVVVPEGALEAEDFRRVAAEVDPWIDKNGPLKGLLVKALSFPGWEDFAGLIEHLKFVRDHHRRIGRVAAVTDSGFVKAASAVAGHFAHPEIRRFAPDEEAAAMAWLEG